MSQTFHKMFEQGALDMAYVYFVSGYPWAVTTDPRLVTALDGTSANQKAVREKMFGKATWEIDEAHYCPAWDVPIFPTLLKDLGSETWKAEDVKGFLSSSSWSVKIQDKPLGHTWDHVATGDELWGLEGVHRVANLDDSDVHGWGFLSSTLARVDDPAIGNAVTTFDVKEESSGRLFNRIDGLSSGEWIPVWIDHECMAVTSVSGSFSPETAYTVTICHDDDDYDPGRGLYKSRPADHLVRDNYDLTPTVRDVPGSIAGEYAWLYGVPLSENGELVLDENDEPIVAIMRQGVVSQDIETKDSVTTVKMLSPIDACKLDAAVIDWIKDRTNYDAHLDKYLICRCPYSGTDETTIVPYWQSPHLIVMVCGYERYSDWDGGLSFRQATSRRIPIWLCDPGETLIFDTYEELFDATVEEVEKVLSGSHEQHTGDGSTGFERPIIPDLIFSTNPNTRNDPVPKIFFAGPLAWILGLGTPTVGDLSLHSIDQGKFLDAIEYYGWPTISITSMSPNADTSFRDFEDAREFYKTGYKDFVYSMECIGNKWTVFDPSQWVWLECFSDQPDKLEIMWGLCPGKQYGFYSPYYYSWDWVTLSSMPETWDGQYAKVEDLGREQNGYIIPASPHDDVRRLYFYDGTDEVAFIDEETVTIGCEADGRPEPVLVGEFDGAISEDSTKDALYGEFDSDTFEVDSNGVFPAGFSLFFLPQFCDNYKNPTDPWTLTKSVRLNNIVFSDVIRVLFGENRPLLDLAPEMQLSYVPFFTTITSPYWPNDFVSIFDWTSMDEIIQPIMNCQYYTLDTTKISNIYDIIKNELLLHKGAMTREWDYDNLMWRIRFRYIEPMNKTDAFYSGRIINESNLLPGGKVETHNGQPIATKIHFDYENLALRIQAEAYSTVKSDREIMTITPCSSKFDYSDEGKFILAITNRFRSMLRMLSRRQISYKATLTLRGFFSAMLNRESIITDPVARIPGTHAVGQDELPAKVFEWSQNLTNNTLSIAFQVGGDASFGWAPTCRLKSGNFTTHTTYWWGVPEDHDYSSDYEAKDIYRFDCYDLANPSDPQVRSCSCGSYAVHAIEERNKDANLLYFDADVVLDGATLKLKLTGDNTASIDTDKDYRIQFAYYNNCEDCQKHYVFGADMNNTLGSAADPANRWTG